MCPLPAQGNSERVPAALWWLLPAVICVAVHRHAFTAWFQQDDFVWLALQVDGARSMMDALFTPTPHGTLRPWGDRGFFLLMKGIFGLNAAAFHAAIFLMQFASLALLVSLVGTLTASRTAGLLAALFWTVNPALVLPLVWISGVYQVMGALCFLLGLRLFVAYADTGRRRWLVGQWAVFLFGLGAIESIVVYPLMAALFVALYARERLRQVLPMCVVSGAFVAHRLLIANSGAAGPYAMHFDRSIGATLVEYWRLAAGFGQDSSRTAVIALVTAGLLAFAIARSVRGDRLPGLFLGWSVLPLLPVLPLKDHVTEYYLTVPLASVAALGAYATLQGWRAGSLIGRLLAAGVACSYLFVAVSASDFGTRWWRDRSLRAETTFAAVLEANRRHPERVILLENVDNDLFWSCVIYRPFKLAGIRDVYLAPGAEAQVKMTPGLPPLSEWMIAAPAALELRERNRLVVLRLTEDRFVDVTSSWVPSGGSSR